MAVCVLPGEQKPNLVGNTTQTCCLTCDDGTAFCVRVPNGAVLGRNQEIANAIAYSLACNRAAEHRFCIPDFSNRQNTILFCLNQLVDVSLRISKGKEPLTWTLIGSLPPGLLDSNSQDSRTLFINGHPTSAGTFTFTYLVTDSEGFHIQKTFTIKVFGVVENHLPDANGGVFYSQQLHGDGGTAPYKFVIAKGSLPPDLALTDDGLISGNASCGGGQIYDFTVGITDAGGVKCTSDLSINCIGVSPPPPPTCPGLASTFALGDGFPTQIAGCPFRQKIYVGISNINQVSVFNTITHALVGSAALPSQPYGMAYVPPKKATSSSTAVTSPFTVPAIGQTVLMVVGDTSWMTVNKIIFTDPPGAFQVIAIQDATRVLIKFLGFSGDVPPGYQMSATTPIFNTMVRTDLVYVTAASPDRLCAIDPDAGICFDVALLANNAGYGSVFHSPTSNVICFGTAGHLYSYDLLTGNLVTTSQPGRFLAYSSTLDRMYIVAQNGNNAINTVVPKTLAVVAPGTFYTQYGLVQGEGAYCRDTGHLYVASIDYGGAHPIAQSVSVFDPTTGFVVANIPLTPELIAYSTGVAGSVWDIAGRRIVVGLNQKIAVINPFTRTLLCYVNTEDGSNRGGYFDSYSLKDFVWCNLNNALTTHIEVVS